MTDCHVSLFSERLLMVLTTKPMTGLGFLNGAKWYSTTHRPESEENILKDTAKEVRMRTEPKRHSRYPLSLRISTRHHHSHSFASRQHETTNFGVQDPRFHQRNELPQSGKVKTPKHTRKVGSHQYSSIIVFPLPWLQPMCHLIQSISLYGVSQVYLQDTNHL